MCVYMYFKITLRNTYGTGGLADSRILRNALHRSAKRRVDLEEQYLLLGQLRYDIFT